MTTFTKRVAVSGANRGIGLAFVGQLAKDSSTQVIALARTPTPQLEGLSHSKNIEVVDLDLANAGSIEVAVKSIAKMTGGKLDLLINCAGHFAGKGDEHKIVSLTNPAGIKESLDANVCGPVMLINGLLPILRAGEGKTVVNISSDGGLMSEMLKLAAVFPGMAEYQISKAALNMVNCLYATELKPDGIKSVLFNPGWCRTRLGGDEAHLDPNDSVSAMLSKINELTLDDSGKFFTVKVDLTVEEHPW